MSVIWPVRNVTLPLGVKAAMPCPGGHLQMYKFPSSSQSPWAGVGQSFAQGMLPRSESSDSLISKTGGAGFSVAFVALDGLVWAVADPYKRKTAKTFISVCFRIE